MADSGNTSATEYLKAEAERHRENGESREADACLMARRKLLSRGGDDDDGDEYVDPDTCPECGKDTNKFIGECDHCGYNRWRAEQ